MDHSCGVQASSKLWRGRDTRQIEVGGLRGGRRGKATGEERRGEDVREDKRMRGEERSGDEEEKEKRVK